MRSVILGVILRKSGKSYVGDYLVSCTKSSTVKGNKKKKSKNCGLELRELIVSSVR